MVAGGWRLTVGAAMLVTSAVVVPAAQADTGCEWIATELAFPAGVHPGGLLVGDGDWMASTSRRSTAVVWHDEVPMTVNFPVERAVYDISPTGVLLSVGSDGVWRGEERLEPLPGRQTWSTNWMNTGGDVLGRSDGALAVWPAGSASPTLVEDTDDGRAWWPKGIDDAGNVIGNVDGEAYVWNREGDRTRLQPLPGHDKAYSEFVFDGRVFGRSHSPDGDYGTSVEWNLRGEVVRTLPGGAVMAANHAGDLLMFGDPWPGGQGTAVLRANGRVDPLILNVFPDVITESGDVFGGRYFDRPLKLACA